MYTIHDSIICLFVIFTYVSKCKEVVHIQKHPHRWYTHVIYKMDQAQQTVIPTLKANTQMYHSNGDIFVHWVLTKSLYTFNNPAST